MKQTKIIITVDEITTLKELNKFVESIPKNSIVTDIKIKGA